jgi:serine/threonine-protein kinase
MAGGAELVPGDLVAGRFEIVSQLAEGGMGRVYRAVQRPIGRPVAIKILHPELTNSDVAAARFFQEAVAASGLRHPNTITILDYGETDEGMLYMAMELLEGESLQELLSREGRLGLRRAMDIVVQVARSLAEAHEHGVIHRDLKPENIFISHVGLDRDLVKVLDFGIAQVDRREPGKRITQVGYVCGTPEYMSPEQARGDNLAATSDLYSLGIVLWEMLAGRVPYCAQTPLGTVLKHQNEPIPALRVDVPQPVKAFLYRVLAKSPEDRPQCAGEFLRDLQTSRLSLSPEGVQKGPWHRAVERQPKRAKRARMRTISAEIPRRLIGLLTAAVLSFGAILLFGLSTPPSEASHSDSWAGERSQQETALRTEVELVAVPQSDVFEGGRFIGQTPMVARGEPGARRTFTLRRHGFSQTTVEAVYPAAGLRVLEVELSRGPSSP